MGLHVLVQFRSRASVARRTAWLLGTIMLGSAALCAASRAQDASPADDARTEKQALYSSRLSILNGGQPGGQGLSAEQLAELTIGLQDPFTQPRVRLDRGQFRFTADSDNTDRKSTDGAPNKGQPIAGDFNGDGITEIGLFVDGEWFIDLNGNGAWDGDDLWAQLGGPGDQPLVGDWDGDGKADIGVFGADPLAVPGASGGGLPDADNATPSRAQSPAPGQAVRLLKRGADGEYRADYVDHVLIFGREPGQAVAGDFNGDGIDTIAVFRAGDWYLDVDGDGRKSVADVQVSFGQPGDRPIVGDFNGDGVDDLGVYRAGAWLIQPAPSDDDGPREPAAAKPETVWRLGSAADLPVVGDWDGDGRDEAAVFLIP